MKKRFARVEKIKPLLRGWSHLFASFAALIGGVFLVSKAMHAHAFPNAVEGTVIYSICLLVLFTMSATYHRPMWSPEMRAMLRRADHSAIYLMIAGSSTAVGVLTLREITLFHFLLITWIGAAVGISAKLFWKNAPRTFTALAYVLISFAAAPYFPQIMNAMGQELWSFLLAGGVIYISGAVVYALRWPNPSPEVFGYHEIFHLLVIAASACHYSAILKLVLRQSGAGTP